MKTNKDMEKLPVEEISFEEAVQAEEKERSRRKRWLLLLLLLLTLCCVGGLFVRYYLAPEPLPEMVLPDALEPAYPPHYLFSIYGIDQPVGVTVSPDGDRIYVSESGGERLVKAFDRDGQPLFSFSPPESTSAQRSPVYLAFNSENQLYVADRLQYSINIYDLDGIYLDTIVDRELSLSEYINKHVSDYTPGDLMTYNIYEKEVTYQGPDDAEASVFPVPDFPSWVPLGIWFDQDDTLFITDLLADNHSFSRIDLREWDPGSGQNYSPRWASFGVTGQLNGEFLYPNKAVVDSNGNTYITDGNNGRVARWSPAGEFQYHIGQGTGDAGLNLPRGLIIDQRDRLYVVDAVAQNIKVFNVAGDEPEFLFTFGDFGIDDGLFNYPNDIAIDSSGRIYITDRENNRVQVWSY
jgi:sugar lactone lactonase YvrE